MHVQVNLQPGQKGAKKLLDYRGDRLTCVRRRYDETRQRRLKTVELIVEEAPWSPPVRIPGETLVGIHVTFRKLNCNAGSSGRAENRTRNGASGGCDMTKQWRWGWKIGVKR